MKRNLIFILHLIVLSASAQNANPISPFDARHWGVVLDHPGMKDVIIKPDVPYLKNEKGILNIDIYSPPNLKSGDLRPAVIFLNGIGETAGADKVKSWGIYKSWPQLMAAHGFIGISMESDGARIQESFQSLFKFLSEKGNTYHVDANKLGVYAASANVTQSTIYLMKEDAYKGIQAAVLYYGGTPRGPYRKDLPVLFVITEGDVGRNGYGNLWSEVLKNNAPWTIQMATGLPHAFDAFEDTDESRKVVKETISFWKNYLEPVAQPAWLHSLPRQVLSAQYMQDHNKAADLAKQWLDTHPDDAGALRAYSGALKNAGRFAEAETIYKKSLAQKPNNSGLLFDLATVMYGLNKPDEAESYMAQAIKTGELNRFHYLSMGRSLYNFKKYSESAKYYEILVTMEPNGVDFYNLACSYALANEKDKAFESLNKAIDRGFTSKQQFETDTDLTGLRNDARYNTLMERLANPSTTTSQTNIPPKRAHHALVYDESTKRVLMTAGSTPLNGGESYKFFNDVWQFDGTKWSLTGSAGNERSGIRLVYDSRQKKIFSYGGFLVGNQSTGELRVLEGSEWKILSDLPDMKAAEPGFVHDIQRNKLIAFGGSAERGKMNNSTWEWNGKSWKKFEGQSPEGRMGFVMEYDSKRNKTVIYGGSGEGPHSLDDTWEFDGKKWTKVSDSGPGPRVSPGYAFDSKRGLLIIFGGAGKDGLLGDTWSWNGKEWKKLSDTGPSPRVMGQLAYDIERDRIVMFGGRPGWPNDANDTWEWDGTKWSEIK